MGTGAGIQDTEIQATAANMPRLTLGTELAFATLGESGTLGDDNVSDEQHQILCNVAKEAVVEKLPSCACVALSWPQWLPDPSCVQ